MQPMEGAVMSETTILLFHINMVRVQTPGEVNSLYSLMYLINDYYIHYIYIYMHNYNIYSPFNIY